MEDMVRFKHLLEYFAAHLDHMSKGRSDKSIGFAEYIKPLIDNNCFIASGQGYNGGKIQSSVKDWDTYNGNKIAINVQSNYGDYGTKKCYLNFVGTGINIFWSQNELSIGYAYWWFKPTQYEIIKESSFKDLRLFDGTENISDGFSEFYTIFMNEIDGYINKTSEYYTKTNEYLIAEAKQMKLQKLQPYIDLLKRNKNLVLTGTPGTGKTFMAFEIAELMGAEKEFVQFHPSYDYTDFVEGLRPDEIQDGQMNFKRVDGIFKKFCKRALHNIEESSKSPEERKRDNTVTETFKSVVCKIQDGEIEEIPLRGGSKKMIALKRSNEDIIYLRTKESDARDYYVSLNRILKLSTNYKNLEELNQMQNIDKEIRECIKGCHTSAYWAVLHLIYEEMIKSEPDIVIPSSISERPFVFIIDEINRGDASKIFGELFFAIDPGYRGDKEKKVTTQYQTLIEEGDVFKNGFYVPENVYILATMNDIDRSVESMDFAMRRRFTWKEITPEDTQSMLDVLENEADNAREHMHRINEKISDIEGLGAAYKIGPSYFLKLKDPDYNYEKLWDLNIEPLLREYLRGYKKVNDTIKELKDAYYGIDSTNVD